MLKEGLSPCALAASVREHDERRGEVARPRREPAVVLETIPLCGQGTGYGILVPWHPVVVVVCDPSAATVGASAHPLAPET